MSLKVLIGCPTWIGKKYCINRYLNGVLNLDYEQKYFMIVDNSSTDEYVKLLREKGIHAIKGQHYDDPAKSVVESRNILRERLLEDNFEYFLSLEQDVVMPRSGLKQLMEQNKRVVSGLYFTIAEVNNKPVMAPMAWVKADKEFAERVKANPSVYKEQYEQLQKHNFDIEKVKRRLTFEEVKEPRLMEVLRIGLGCALIHRDVMEKIKFRHNPHGYDDMTFCQDVLDNKWKLYLDTSVKCRHFVKE